MMILVKKEKVLPSESLSSIPPHVRPQGGVIQKIHPDLESAPQKTLGAGRYAQTDQYPRLYTPPHHEL